MKKLSAILVASVLSAASFAQTCTPNPLFVGLGLPGVYPLPTDPLPDGTRSLPYQGASGFTVSFLSSNQAIDPSTLPIALPVPIPPGTSVKITGISVSGVTGLPQGMTYACNIPSCTWNTTTQGCILLSGTPTEAGDFTVTFNASFTGELVSPLGTVPFNNAGPAPVQYDMKIKDDASIDEFQAKGLNLYPNPASDMFLVSYPAVNADMARIEVTDMSGRTVLGISKAVENGGGVMQVDINGLANGLYRVTFSAGSVRTASKLIVRR